MIKLVKKLNEAAKAYYSEGRSVMSDQEYDKLYDELEKMEKETGVVLPDSPTLRAGFEVVSNLEKVTHKHPALSLSKTKDIEELKEFLGEKEGVLSFKCDGLTIQATYSKTWTLNTSVESKHEYVYELITLATRGNGYIGEDVTHNAPYIKGIPKVIESSYNLGNEVVVRGELLINYNNFNKINENLEEKYMNPRNLASASVRLMDTYVSSKRYMEFKAFEFVNSDSPSMESDFKNLETLGFDVVPYMTVKKNGLENAIEIMTPESIDFPVDGLVLAYNDNYYRKSLGMTGKYPKGAKAFKWADTSVTTTLRDIEWSVSTSTTGTLTPVAVFDEVDLEGTTVKRASLCNLSEVKRLGIGANDITTLEVIKANMIIPKVIEASGVGEPSIPSKCPVCGFPLSLKLGKDKETEFLVCKNPNCAAKHSGKFVRLAGRDALNIIGLSEAKLKTLASYGYISRLADVFYLSDYKDEILELDGFGEKSYNNMIDSIEKARECDFKNFFYALGIPGAGHDVAKILEKFIGTNYPDEPCENVLLNLATASSKDILLSLDGIGEIIANNIIDWFKENMCEYLDLADELEITLKVSKGDNSLNEKTFVITGKLLSYPNRNALKEEIEAHGGKVSGSVSSNTDFLINNNKMSDSSKNKKAKSLGINIISEEDFKKML